MGFSVAGSNPVSTILAEISLAQGEGLEEVLVEQELLEPEQMLKELFSKGTLESGGKSFIFTCKEGFVFTQKLTTYLSDINRPTLQKNSDSKKGENHLSFKESTVKEKELTTIKSDKQNLDGRPSEKKDPSLPKTQEVVRRTFEKAVLPKHESPPRDIARLQQQTPHAKTVEHRMHQEVASRKEQQGRPIVENNQRRHVEPRKAQENAREMIQAQNQKLEKKEDQERDSQKRKQEEEEGFAEGNNQNQQQNGDEETKKSKNVTKIDESFAKEFNEYAVQDSSLSEIFKVRVSQFDVLLLFIEIMKLDIKSREQEKLSRRLERELQLAHMQKVVDNYKSQGKWTMFANLGSGVLAIVSGACPIIGHMQGDWILGKLKGFFSSLADVKKDQFFKGITKMTYAMSEMQKSAGQIYQTFAEGDRTYDQHMSDLHKTDWEENTRSMDEIKDNWKGIENFLYQALQMYHETIRQLYSH